MFWFSIEMPRFKMIKKKHPGYPGSKYVMDECQYSRRDYYLIQRTPCKERGSEKVLNSKHGQTQFRN